VDERRQEYVNEKVLHRKKYPLGERKGNAQEIIQKPNIQRHN